MKDKWGEVFAEYLKTVTPEPPPPVYMTTPGGVRVNVGDPLALNESGVDTVYMTCCAGCNEFVETSGRVSAEQFAAFLGFAGWVLCPLPAHCTDSACDRRPALLCPDCAAGSCERCGGCWGSGLSTAPAG